MKRQLAFVLSLAGLAFAGQSFQQAAAETRGYVVNSFTLAMSNVDDDCPGGPGPFITETYRKNLEYMGYKPEDVERIMKGFNNDGPELAEMREIMVNRGRINGQPVNVYDNPTSFPDDNLHIVEGKIAYGFNLDGRGAASSPYEDPETKEQGVNNNYFRIMGCIQSHRAYIPEKSTYWQYAWDGSRDTMPAWVMTITGEDLSKDGDVTVTIDRALEHVLKDANSQAMADATFRVDPDPRFHNVVRGKIKDQVLTIEPSNVRLAGDPFFITELDFRNTHLRMRMKPDGSLEGILGGYQPWLPIYFFYGGSGFNVEQMAGINMPGVYYALRKLADAYPDPKTGQNTHISAGYKIEAIKAFVVPAENRTAQAR
jgi:hypothetical protein